MDTEFELEWHKSKDEELTLLFINITFRTSVHCFFTDFSRAQKTWSVEWSRVKLYRNYLKGNKNYFELTRGSSHRGFELPRVNHNKRMKEIQGKSTLVLVSAKFELARVRVTRSQLYQRNFNTITFTTNNKLEIVPHDQVFCLLVVHLIIISTRDKAVSCHVRLSDLFWTVFICSFPKLASYNYVCRFP